MNGHWQPGQAAWGNNRNAVCYSEGNVYGVQAQLKLKLATNVGDNGKVQVTSKRRIVDDISLLLDEVDHLVSRDIEQAVIECMFFHLCIEHCRWVVGLLEP